MNDYLLVKSMQRAGVRDYGSLFQDSFGGDNKLSEAYLQWQYGDNPDGQVIGFDAFLGDELAAHYAIIPRRYRLGSTVYTAALSVNTATHPKHQGRKLFTRLAEATYAEAAALGVEFVVGAANANSVPGFTRKLGFANLGQISLYLKRSSPAVLANPSRRYVRVEHGDGTCTLRTTVRNAPFNLARVDTALLARCNALAPAVGMAQGALPALTPLFGGQGYAGGLKLPQKLQPSPWHVIFKSLGTGVDVRLAAATMFDGLAMDTF
jgi:GNAT superfamily N-acetyltransferase